jgi:hypothetical protein
VAAAGALGRGAWQEAVISSSRQVKILIIHTPLTRDPDRRIIRTLNHGQSLNPANR